MSPKLTKSNAATCYLCGEVADDPDDHVPPEVLFRGEGGRSYKSPEIVKVPSCREHNSGASQDDELLAYVMSDGGALTSQAAFDISQALLAPVSERIHTNRDFSDKRLQHMGMRILRDPKDYDEKGAPKAQEFDAEYVARVEQILRERWVILERSLQKVAAGLYFHATNGMSLGSLATRKLIVVGPEFKQIGAEIALTKFDLREVDFFSKRLPWQKIESGSPEVFQCEIAFHPGSKRFEMRMLFYNSIRVWVKTGE